MPTKTKKRLKVGDKVFVRFDDREIAGKVTEDRGPIGVGGRRLYGILLKMDGEETYFEAPLEELRVA